MIRMYEDGSAQFKSAEKLTEYMYGGRGIVKLEAPSGTHHFYMFQKPMEKDAFPDDVLFVYAVHNKEKKFYLGMIERGEFRLTRNSRFLPDTDIVRGAFYIMKMASSQSFIESSPMSIYHMGICARCGRALSGEKSIATGIGPKCRKRMNNAKERV